jgi:hypothetical protein
MNRPENRVPLNSTGIRRSRPRATALAALALPLVLITGCGGSDGSDDTEGGSGASKGSSAAKPLTAAQLEAASLVKADVKGYTVKKPGKGDMYTKNQVTVDKDDCVPLGHALSGIALDEPAATAHRQATAEPDESVTVDPEADTDDIVDKAFDLTTTLVTLGSYDSEDASKAALKSVTDGIAACAGGFRIAAQGGKQEVTKVATDTAPKAGDDAVAFTLTVEQDKSKGPLKVVMFRQGTTLAQFTAINVTSMLSGKDFDSRWGVVDARATKLG